MRTQLLERLAAEPVLDAGLLVLLGDVGAALAAVEAVEIEDGPPAA
jgi:hypothetical protein